MFIDFANFYQRFFQSVSRIVALLTSLLKTTESSKLVPKTFRGDDNEVVDDDDSKINKMVVNLFKNYKSRNSTYIPNIRATKESNFLNSNAKKVFNHLQLAFIKAPIFQHFNLKSHIQIETNTSSYAIYEMLS